MTDTNLKVLNADGTAVYEKAFGAGTNGDPNIIERALSTTKGAGAAIGATTDGMVPAGADGSLVALLKRLTTDLDALNTLIEDTDPSPISIANGDDVARGSTTDAPASSSAAQDTTARTEIALLKGMINVLILMNAKLVSGTDIGDVTINNAAGAGVYVQPGTSAEFAVAAAAGKLVDGAIATLGLKADNRSTATDTTAITAIQILKQMSYMLQNPASGAVTNAGTFAVQSTPAVSGKTLKTAVGVLAASGDNTIIAAVGGKALKVFRYALQAVGTVNAKLTDGTGGTQLSMLWNFQAREGVNTGVMQPPNYLFKTTAGNALIMNLSAAIGVGYEVQYWDDDAS
jgi:hypothetical protein